MGDLLKLLGKAHVLSILYTFHSNPGPRRFVELQNQLDISPNTLSDRLKDLVEAGLLTRKAYNEIPPRVDYEATRKADELAEIFQSIQEWSRRNSLSPEPDTRGRATA